jgi:hypothetical protein
MFILLRFAHGALFSLLMLSVVLTINCESVPPEYNAFFSLDWDQQIAKAEKFPIEKQIEYYLAGKKYVHPPSSTLLRVIAKQGKAAIPALLERIKKEDRDSGKIYLLEVFRNIHDFHYDLRGEKEVLAQLQDVVSRMGNRKARGEEILTDIVENRPPRKYGESP